MRAGRLLAVALVLGLWVLLVGGMEAEKPNAQDGLGVQAALGTGFTYQGQLKESGRPVEGSCDLEFALYDAETGGSPVGSAITRTVSVVGGVFSAQLDFGGGVFTGEARWLELGVRCPTGSGSYTALSGRQAVTPVPYALALPGLWTQENITSTNIIGGYSGNSVITGVMGATISGGGASSMTNTVTDNYGTVGGGVGNRAGDNAGTTSDRPFATVGGGAYNTASGPRATVGGGWGNIASGSRATVGGGQNNTAYSYAATVGGGAGNTASGGQATVGGGMTNTASAIYATVSGGQDNDASYSHATVGGGQDNDASYSHATVGGGYNNTASEYGATVGGGAGNTTSGYDAIVAGGRDNTASGFYASVGGGESNTASDVYATVGGGGQNTASGQYATVPGGKEAVAPLYGEMAYASGKFATPGDAQTGVYVLRREVSHSLGTSVELYLDGSSQRLAVPISRTMVFDILVVGRRQDNGQSGAYQIQGVIKNSGGTTSFVGSPTFTTLGTDNGSLGASVQADDDSDALLIWVNGPTGAVVRWVATVRTVEVAW